MPNPVVFQTLSFFSVKDLVVDRKIWILRLHCPNANSWQSSIIDIVDVGSLPRQLKDLCRQKLCTFILFGGRLRDAHHGGFADGNVITHTTNNVVMMFIVFIDGESQRLLHAFRDSLSFFKMQGRSRCGNGSIVVGPASVCRR